MLNHVDTYLDGYLESFYVGTQEVVEYFILKNIPATQHLQNIFSGPGWKVYGIFRLLFLGVCTGGGVSKGPAIKKQTSK